MLAIYFMIKIKDILLPYDLGKSNFIRHVFTRVTWKNWPVFKVEWLICQLAAPDQKKKLDFIWKTLKKIIKIPIQSRKNVGKKLKVPFIELKAKNKFKNSLT